jgi:hypothetical protein
VCFVGSACGYEDFGEIDEDVAALEGYVSAEGDVDCFARELLGFL